MPKTPESGSIERYGDIPLDEFSGVPSIQIPIYDLKSRFLSVPISLSYNASGVKVSQESTWVGLGFDLNAGSRVTVETRGNIDDNIRPITTFSGFKTGLARIFNKSGGGHNTTLSRYAFLDYGQLRGSNDPDFHTGDTLWDGDNTVSNSAWYGAGEPDIYRVSVGGESLTFYIDILTDQIKFIGEKSLFSITTVRDGAGTITKFTIIDNSGIAYTFDQREKSKLTTPSFDYGGYSIYETTTAWLLTRILHPTGDSVKLSYSNYGGTYPVFSWNASLSMSYNVAGVTQSPNTAQNQIELQCWYLTRIESSNLRVDFSLSARQDIRGIGARKLDDIKVVDKQTSEIIRKFAMTYDYVVSGETQYTASLPDSVRNCYNRRLRLLSVKDGDLASSPIHSFFYNPITVNKLSFAQDHWGFYNGATNSSGDPNSPQNMLPQFANATGLIARGFGPEIISTMHVSGPDYYPGSNIGSVSTSFDGTGSRSCSPTMVLAMTMDSIVYPTGGSTKFVFEPHVSFYQARGIYDFVGGGLRVKWLKNYVGYGKIAGQIEYQYQEVDGNPRSSGFYLGALNYLKINNKSLPLVNYGIGGTGTQISMNVSADQNNDKLTVGYKRVKKIQRDFSGNSAIGSVVKTFQVDHPYEPQTITNSQPPYYNCCPIGGGACLCYDPAQALNMLLIKWSGLAPTPRGNLDGKLIKEEVFDNANQLVRATSYYYRQADFSQSFYSLKVEDNYPSSQGQILVGDDFGVGNTLGNNWRRWSMCLSPAKSFFTLLDSMVTKEFAATRQMTQKIAYTFNSSFQQQKTIQFLSDGSQGITDIKTPLSFSISVPASPTNRATAIADLKTAHIFNAPIEKLSMIKLPTNDTVVTAGELFTYAGALLTKTHVLQTAKPLPLSSNFVSAFFYCNWPTSTSYDFVFDSRYQLYDSALYFGNSLVKEIYSRTGVKSFGWDGTYFSLMSVTNNSKFLDMAYTSFESNTQGNWTYSGVPVVVALSPGGKYSYDLASGSITKTSLSSSATYMVSYWSNSGAKSVNGAAAIAGPPINGWTMYVHKVVNPTSGVITLSGTGYVDEVRVFPDKALMSSYVMKPFVGIQSQFDANNRPSYFEYDAIGRLSIARDENRYILKKYEYKYIDQPYAGNIFYNEERSGTFIKVSCATCLAGTSVKYVVPDGKLSSNVSQADANQMAQNDVTSNGQTYANANGTCVAVNTCPWVNAYNFSSPNANFFAEGGTCFVTLVVHPISGSYGSLWSSGISVGTINCTCKPLTTKTFNSSESGRNWLVTISSTGDVQVKLLSGTYPGAGAYFQVSGTYLLN